MRVCPECGHESEAERCPDDGRLTLDKELLEASDPWLGRVIADKYRMEARIGRGGMGSVYRARHTETDGPVAVKVLHASVRGDPQAIKRFHLEAQNAAGLTHSHTTRVNDFGVEGESPYLVMEYLDGRPLSALIREQGALPWQRAVRIISGVFKSLWEAHEHERRIVHRDIKPQNIVLVDQQGASDFVKVLDFGISRSLESAGADTVGPVGTPHYMAPEQWRGGEVDGRADLYSCGCVLYELLSGQPPFSAEEDASPTQRIAALAQKHLNQLPTRLVGQGDPVLPPDLVELTHDLLAKDPAMRPQTAAAALQRLGALTTQDEGDATMPYVVPAAERLVVESGIHRAVGDTPECFDDTLATGAGELDLSVTSPKPPPATTKSRLRRGAGIAVLLAIALVVGGLLIGRPAPNPARLGEIIRDVAATRQERNQAARELLAFSQSRGEAPDFGGALLDGAGLQGQSLKAADLKRADLAEADLQKSDLSGADLREARLVGANLRGAVLRQADLRGADLRGAVLTDTVLDGSRYDQKTHFPDSFDHRSSGAHGPGAVLGGVDLSGADLRGTSFRDANLMRAVLSGANLHKAELAGANIRGARLVDAVLRDADLHNADLRHADLSGADLRGATLDGVDLRGARYSAETRWPEGFAFRRSGAAGPDADLQRADLQGVDLRGADLRRADVRAARLQGADLREAKLEQARFSGAIYDGSTRWPQGFEPAQAGARRSDDPGSAAAAAGPDASAAAGPDASADVADAGSAAADAQDDSPAAGGPVASAAKADRGDRRPIASPRPAARPKAALAPTKPITSQPVEPRPVAAPAVPEVVAEAATAAGPGAEPDPRPTPPRYTGPPLRPFTDKSRRNYVEADLRNGDLSGLDLTGADFRWAQYNRHTRWPAGFNYRECGAIGPGASLAGRVMRDAALRGVDLRATKLRGADLRGADMRGCRLEDADLRDTRLHGANLSRCQMRGVRLQGARFSTTTQWPAGFDPATAGARVEL